MSSSRCVHCQAPLSRSDARFCTNCGKAQPPNPPPPVQPAGPTTLLGMPAAIAPDQSTPSAYLTISEAGGPARTLQLGDQPLSIGRAADSDLVLSLRFVSGRHARIEPRQGGHTIVDVGSTNGLLFAGVKVQRHDLRDGDVLRIGDPESGSFVSLTYHNPAAARQNSAATPQRYQLDPNDAQITIGRVGCDLLLDSPQVSRFHAQLDRQADGSHILRDAGSSNGTFINGARVSLHSLKVGDIIQIGAFKLVYTPTSLDEYNQQGELRIDARGLTRKVAGGRIILQNVSISIAPREFVAIVGGSGTGKSTLMKALCGYAPASEGSVQINGDDFYRNFNSYRSVLGYVPQDDIIHRPLPVERALDYSARLRLPSDTTDQEISQRIERVLDAVEMELHRATPVESLSGGQRKRVSISAELLADPSLFFLDEPTSGLDPGLEKKMMYTLRRLADSGRTVVLVTHATTNIAQCDHVAFMGAGGRLAYFGPPSEAAAFFGVANGDFADIYTRIEGYAEPQSPLLQRELKTAYEAWRAANPDPNHWPLLAELWEAHYRSSEPYRRHIAERLAAAPAAPVVAQAGGSAARAPKVSRWRQVVILTRRYLDLTLQDRRNLWLLILQAPIIAILLLLVAQPDALLGTNAEDLIARSEAKKVLFMIATTGVWFGIINAAREITKEVPIYRRERLVNLRIGPYLASKVAVLLGLVIAQTVILLGLLSLRIAIPWAGGVLLPIPLELFITTLLTSLAGACLGLAVSAFAATPDRAISVVPLVLIPQILFAGLIFELDGLATPLSWLTISRWAMDALGMSLDLNQLCNLPNLRSGDLPPGCGPGFLSSEAAYTPSPDGLLGRWGALFAHIAAALGLAAWQLRRRDREI